MVSANGFDGSDSFICDRVEKSYERQLMLTVVDLAAKERRPRAIFFCFFQQVKGVVGGTAGAAEDAGDESGVVRRQLFHGAGTVVGDFEKHRPAGAGNTGERADDQIVNKAT